MHLHMTVVTTPDGTLLMLLKCFVCHRQRLMSYNKAFEDRNVLLQYFVVLSIASGQKRELIALLLLSYGCRVTLNAM